MTIDTGASSPWKDRIYVTWSFYTQAQTADPSTWRTRTTTGTPGIRLAVSGSSETLCPINSDGSPSGICNANQFSNRFVAPNGDVFVAFQNFNNCFGAFGPPCGGTPTTNPTRCSS